MISTRDLSGLPDVRRLRTAFQAMAMLDAIIMPERQFRYYEFEANALPDGKISIGSMCNGSGDDLYAIFGDAGCLIRGFAHEYPANPCADAPTKVFGSLTVDEVPTEFVDFYAALSAKWWQHITFWIWRRHSDAAWHRGEIDSRDDREPDGSEYLLSRYDGRPDTYWRWAEEYYEPNRFSLAAVTYIFDHRPLTEEIVRELNPQRSLADLANIIWRIGYGHGSVAGV